MKTERITMEYIGKDDFSRPVYRDPDGKLWKDTDPRCHVEASLYSSSDNTMCGEPELMFRGKCKFVPKRMTW